MKKRNEFVDFIKGLAIILVVIGHCIQYGSGNDFLSNGDFWTNKLFVFIYSFHMPLFMLISGYFFYYSANRKNFKELIISLIKTLVVPIIAFSTLKYLLLYGVQLSNMNIFELVKSFVSTIVYNLWFIWAILFSSIIVLLIKYIFNDNPLVYIIMIIVFFVTPDFFTLYLLKFLYPFFILGYFYSSKECNINKFIKKNFLKIGIFLGAAFVILLMFYNKDAYIYVSKIYIFSNEKPFAQIIINIYRIIIGIIGSVFFIMITYAIYNKVELNKCKKVISLLGLNSLGIYAIHLQLIEKNILFFTNELKDINYFITLICTLGLLIICTVITILAKKIRPINIVFFGGR